MSYLQELLTKKRERRQRIAARAVPDRGIDLKGGRAALPAMPPVYRAPIVPTLNVQPVSKYVERAPSKDPVALDNQRALTEFVIEFMAGHSGFTREQLLEGRKLAHVSRARTLTQYILYRHVKLSYNGVARAMNRLDHTTAMHAVKRIEAAIKQNPGYAKSIDNLIQQIKEKWET